jgi:hypothetical protein
MPDGKILPIDELFQPLLAESPAAAQHPLMEAAFRDRLMLEQW